MTEYITAKELCKMLDVNRVDVAELTSIGELKAQKTKGRWKINKKSAENLKKKNQKKIESIQKEYVSVYWQGLTHQQLQKRVSGDFKRRGIIARQRGFAEQTIYDEVKNG